MRDKATLNAPPLTGRSYQKNGFMIHFYQDTLYKMLIMRNLCFYGKLREEYTTPATILQ